jgi:hypothetical protein
MKIRSILLVLWLAVLVLPLRADPPGIKINSIDSVVIGETDEPLADALLNAERRGVTAKDIQDAVREWVKTLAAQDNKLTSLVAKVKEAVNAGDLDAAKLILEPEITKVEQSEKDKKKAELDEQIAKLQAERDELDKAAAAVKTKLIPPAPKKK